MVGEVAWRPDSVRLHGGGELQAGALVSTRELERLRESGAPALWIQGAFAAGASIWVEDEDVRAGWMSEAVSDHHVRFVFVSGQIRGRTGS